MMEGGKSFLYMGTGGRNEGERGRMVIRRLSRKVNDGQANKD
jgi:hypothetical protein